MTAAAKKGHYLSAVGRRKRAVARVRLLDEKANSIKISVNGRDYKEYFPYFEWQELILKPFKTVGRDKAVVSVKVQGGGIRGQVDAVRHGISRVLLATEESLRTTLRKEGLLTRDSRRKERKKPGLKKARKSPQWSKR